MIPLQKFRVRAGISVAALTALLLTGCSGAEVESKYPDMTLAETKSPVQLLRNEAASRIPVSFIDTVDNAVDASAACQTKERDPEGIIRNWDSTVRVSLMPGAGKQVQSIVDDLVKSFEVQGWVAGTFGGASIIELTSATSPVLIHISKVKPTDETGAGAKIQLTASGPCVITDGEDSDEILELEGRTE